MDIGFEPGQRVVYRGWDATMRGRAGVVQEVLAVSAWLQVLLDGGPRGVIRPARDWRPEGPVDLPNRLSQLEALAEERPPLARRRLAELLEEAGFKRLSELVDREWED